MQPGLLLRRCNKPLAAHPDGARGQCVGRADRLPGNFRVSAAEAE